MPGYVKIGRTDGDLASRVRQLDSTGVPLPFEVFYAARVRDSAFVERQLHAAFGDRRVRANREFFTVEQSRVRAGCARLAADHGWIAANTLRHQYIWS